MLEGADLDPRSAIDPLTKSIRFRQGSILKRNRPMALRSNARDLHRELFAKLPREGEDGLVADTRDSFKTWLDELKSYGPVAAGKLYPGKTVINQATARIGKQLAIRDNPAPYAQINRIDPLLGTVAVANDRIAGSEREAALPAIEEKLAVIDAALN